MEMCSSFYKFGRSILRRWHWLAVGFLIVWALFPILWAFSSSLKTRFEVYHTPPTFLPQVPQFENYRAVFSYPNFNNFLFNSVFLAVASTTIVVIVAVLAGYAFARHKFRFGSIAFVVIIIPRIIPRASLIIPLYRIAASLGALDTYLGLVVSYSAISVPLATWILTGFFKGIPREMEDSARVDGASRLQTIRLIAVPMATPALVTVIVFALREAWNELPFVLALTTQTRMRTLQYHLLALQDQIGIINWPVILAFTVVTIVPLVAAYMVFQRRVVSSLVSGALK